SDKPSSVSAFAVGRWPATEKSASVESVAASERTPGARAATVFRSSASTGRRDSWSADRLRPTAPGPTRSTKREPRRALTVTASSGTADAPICTFATSRSSSPWRATLTVAGAMPMKRIVRSYCPPPSGNTMVKRPRASVVAWREIWVSTERACTSAPASRWLSGPTTGPVMMSVVVRPGRRHGTPRARAPAPGAVATVAHASGLPQTFPRRRHRRGHLLGPMRLLPPEDRARHFDERPRAMQAKAPAPRPRHAVEVLRREQPGGGARLLGRHRIQADPAGDIREHMSGVPHGITQHHRIEVDEDHPVARQEDVVGLEISVNRGGRHLLQPGRHGGGNRPNVGGELGPRPLD